MTIQRKFIEKSGIFYKTCLFSRLLCLLLLLHFNPIILFHPNVIGTFIYNWTKYKLDWGSLRYP